MHTKTNILKHQKWRNLFFSIFWNKNRENVRKRLKLWKYPLKLKGVTFYDVYPFLPRSITYAFTHFFKSQKYLLWNTCAKNLCFRRKNAKEIKNNNWISNYYLANPIGFLQVDATHMALRMLCILCKQPFIPFHPLLLFLRNPWELLGIVRNLKKWK